MIKSFLSLIHQTQVKSSAKPVKALYFPGLLNPPIGDIPAAVLLENVVIYLDPRDIIRLIQVNRALYQLLSHLAVSNISKELFVEKECWELWQMVDELWVACSQMNVGPANCNFFLKGRYDFDKRVTNPAVENVALRLVEARVRFPQADWPQWNALRPKIWIIATGTNFLLSSEDRKTLAAYSVSKTPEITQWAEHIEKDISRMPDLLKDLQSEEVAIFRQMLLIVAATGSSGYCGGYNFFAWQLFDKMKPHTHLALRLMVAFERRHNMLQGAQPISRLFAVFRAVLAKLMPLKSQKLAANDIEEPMYLYGLFQVYSSNLSPKLVPPAAQGVLFDFVLLTSLGSNLSRGIIAIALALLDMMPEDAFNSLPVFLQTFHLYLTHERIPQCLKKALQVLPLIDKEFNKLNQ